MPVKRLLTDDQHNRAFKLYMKEHRPVGEIASILMAENEGLVLTSRQISEYVATRSWGKRKKALVTKGETKAAQLITTLATQMAAQKAEQLTKHKDFLETAVRIGGKVMTKAETIIDNTGNARDLASAANAAAKGIEIYRKAVGLDDSGGNGGSPAGVTNFLFNFARGADSPFSKQPPAEEEETDVLEAEVVEEKPIDKVDAPSAA